MSVISKASFVNIPSGYGEDKLYSEVPNTTNGDFTFTRASTGTRVNADGYIEEVPWNQLTYSEDFSSWGTWRQGAALPVTVTTDVAESPIGTLTADRIQCDQVATGSPNRVGVRQDVTYAPLQRFTISVWAKSASGSDESFKIIGRNATGITQGNFIATNEWQKFSRIFEMRSTGITVNVIIGLFQNTDTTTTDIYLWGAQIVLGETEKTYIKTTDRLDIPRLDYSGGASCPTLLLEPQRTNLVPYSEDFSQWSAIGSNQTLVNNTNPIDSNAYEIESSVTSSHSRIYLNALMTAGNDYSSTYLVKPSSNPPEYLGFACISNTQPDVLYDFANDQFVDFNIVGNAAKCESISMNNGWKLLKVPVHESVINTRLNIYQGRRVGNNLYGTTGESYYIKFAQLEQGSYTTSYIPTNGTSVTRVQDVCEGAGDATIFNDSEGVLFFEGSYFEDIIGNVISLGNGTNNDVINFRTDTIGRYKFFVGSNSYLTNFNEYDVSENHKIALLYSTNSFKVFIDGVKKHDTTISFTPSIVYDTLNFSNQLGGTPTYGKCKQLVYFNEALTDTELITLTTI